MTAEGMGASIKRKEDRRFLLGKGYAVISVVTRAIWIIAFVIFALVGFRFFGFDALKSLFA